MSKGKVRLFLQRVLLTLVFSLISFVRPSPSWAMSTLNTCFANPVNAAFCADNAIGIKQAVSAPIVKYDPQPEVIDAEILDSNNNVIGTTPVTVRKASGYDNPPAGSPPGSSGNRVSPTRTVIGKRGLTKNFAGQIFAEVAVSALFATVPQLLNLQNQAKDEYCFDFPGDVSCSSTPSQYAIKIRRDAGNFEVLYGNGVAPFSAFPLNDYSAYLRDGAGQNIAYINWYPGDQIIGWCLNNQATGQNFLHGHYNTSTECVESDPTAWENWPQEKRDTAVNNLPDSSFVDVINNSNSPSNIVQIVPDNLPNLADKIRVKFPSDTYRVIDSPVPNGSGSPSPTSPPTVTNPSPAPGEGGAIVIYIPGGQVISGPDTNNPPDIVVVDSPDPDPDTNPDGDGDNGGGNPPTDPDCQCCESDPVEGELPSLDTDCDVTFTDQNFISYALSKTSDKFPFDIFGDLSAFNSNSPCPTFTFWGQTHEFCIINDTLKAFKWIVWITFTIKSIVSL